MLNWRHFSSPHADFELRATRARQTPRLAQGRQQALCAPWRASGTALKTGPGDAIQGNPSPQGLEGPTSCHGARAPARSARPARTGQAAIVGLAPDGVGTVVVRFGDVPVVVVCVVVVAEVVVAVIVEVVAAVMTAQAMPTPLASKTARTRPTTSAFVRPVVTKTPPLRAQPPEVL
mmetsp:Transcript_26185/g.78978  ORF Transcript_26185/g.78978 Transcript_26185/m.78978 type:complete len:176 (-) Transcript_26185:444-971(-)